VILPTENVADLLREEDLEVEVIRAKGGAFVVFSHERLGERFQYPLEHMSRGALEFVWQTMKSITMDVELALKVSAEAAKIVAKARGLSVTQLTEWASSQSRSLVFISIFELLRRGESVPEEAIYGNSYAMSDAAIRDFLRSLGNPDRETL
jgi:hypothetical protein